MAFIAQGKGLAFGVDTRRKERYSLRQSRYYALSLDISALAGAARREGRRLKLLDIGVGTGICRRYIEVQPDADNIDYYGADLQIYDLPPRRLAGDLCRRPHGRLSTSAG